MIPIGIGLWLPSALLLSWVPGCVPLRGPSSVTGTVGESLSVTCQYEERVKMNKKFWCRGSLNIGCEVIVKTGRSEAGNGRVSFRDHPDNLIFTVTVQNLTLEDAGTYMCGVYPSFYDPSLGNDKSFKVELSVIPGSSPGSSTKVPETIRSTPVHTQPSVTTDDTIPAPSPQPRSLLSSLRFCILVFLELPLFLCMLSAVLWVNRTQRCCGRQSIGPCHENQ